MKPVEEIVRSSPGLSFCYQERDEPLSFSWHYHREYEFTCILEGSGRRFVGDDVAPFDARELVLIGSGLPHAFESSRETAGRRCKTIIIQFPPELFAAERLQLKELRDLHELLRLAERGLAFDASTSAAILPIIRESTRHDGLVKLIDLIRILDLAARMGRWRPIASEWYRRDASSIDPEEPPEAGDLLQFVFANAFGRLTLRGVAEFAGFSVASLCRYFRRNVGCSFNEYLARIRISQACNLLLQTELPIYSISYRAGFDNLSNFNRRFLRMKGMTPSAYRRVHHSRPSEPALERPASSA